MCTCISRTACWHAWWGQVEPLQPRLPDWWDVQGFPWVWQTWSVVLCQSSSQSEHQTEDSSLSTAGPLDRIWHRNTIVTLCTTCKYVYSDGLVYMYIVCVLSSTYTFLRSVLMSYPEMMAVPLEGEISPIKILKVVVLPAPCVRKWYSFNTLIEVHTCTCTLYNANNNHHWLQVVQSTPQ